MSDLQPTGRRPGITYGKHRPLAGLSSYKKMNFWAIGDNLSEPVVVFSMYTTTRVLPSDQSFGRITCNRIRVVCPLQAGLRNNLNQDLPRFRRSTSSCRKGGPGCGES